MPAPRQAHQVFREACQIARAKGLFILTQDAGQKKDYIVCRKLPNGRSTRLATRGSVTTLHRYVVQAAKAE